MLQDPPDNQSACRTTGHHPVGRDQQAGSTDPTKIREAILAVKKYAVLKANTISTRTATVCMATNVVRNEKGTIVYDKHIDFNDEWHCRPLPIREGPARIKRCRTFAHRRVAPTSISFS